MKSTKYCIVCVATGAKKPRVATWHFGHVQKGKQKIIAGWCSHHRFPVSGFAGIYVSAYGLDARIL